LATALYASPFLGLDGSYGAQAGDARDRLVISIEEHEGGARMLTATLVLERRPLTDRALLRLLLRRPLMTQRTIGWIHWHALRLWLRGAPFRRHGAASPGAASLVHVASGPNGEGR
jgi:DUF1365 family protein